MSPNSESLFTLEGRTALITGSTKGLGKTMAFALGRAGAKVALNYFHDSEKAEETLTEFKALGLVGMVYQADVTDETEVNALVKKVEADLGGVDILVLNATPDQPHKAIEDYDWEFYQSMLDFFIKSPFLLTRGVLAHMKAQKWGRIINIGSEVFHLGVPNFSAYVAAKGGQNGWSRSMSRELIPFGINVNMISPGWIPVERHVKDPQSVKDQYLREVPAGRWGFPQDLEGVITFLASESSSFIVGQNIHVNGGMTVF